MNNDGTTATARKSELWKFAGVRVDSKGAKTHVFVDPDGRELWFAAKGAYSIGATYTVTVERRADGLSMVGHPAFTHKRDPEDPQVLAWEAAHYSAESRLAAAVRERQAMKETAFNEAMRPLLEAAKSLRTSADRTAFAARIIREIEGAWR